MTQQPIPRAGTSEAEVSSSFRPGADPDKWIDQHAAAYRERPAAVLRELLQNAVDAMRKSPVDSRFVEVAVLSKEAALPAGQFHLVVRDAGSGMSEDVLKRALGILGYSTKSADDIGEFGVGFYATHAISFEVAILTKAEGTDICGWRYLPSEKLFVRIDEAELKILFAKDFQNHPRPARRRDTGTSIYLRLDVDQHSECGEWLSSPKLALNMRRDCLLLPTAIFVADYSDNAEGSRIPDAKGRDLKDVSLSVVSAPWASSGADLDALLPRIFEHVMPYTDPPHYPKEFHSFSRPIDDGSVSGFLYLTGPRTEGWIDVFLKQMRVETAEDIAPTPAYPVFGFLDISPGTRFDARVLSARDRMVRNSAYLKMCTVVEDECLELYEVCGRAIQGDLSNLLRNASTSSDGFRECLAYLNGSTSHRVLASLDRVYTNVLRDLVGTLNKIVTAPACPEVIKQAIVQFADAHSPGALKVTVENLSSVLQTLHAAAEDTHEKERAAQSSDRKAPTWNPRSSLKFVEKSGPYLPFTVHRRDQGQPGRFATQTGRISLSALRLIEPDANNSLTVLTKGAPVDYLIRNKRVPFVIQVQSDVELIVLALVRHVCCPEVQLEFVTFERDLFKEMTLREEWTPLVDFLRDVIVSNHDPKLNPDLPAIDARGYDPDYLPLLAHTEEGRSTFVINGYNDLMKELKTTYRGAIDRNDGEIIGLLAKVLHELYHNVSSASVAERPPEDRHLVTTRTDLIRAVLSITEKYADLKLR
jgi:hypothetical protein